MTTLRSSYVIVWRNLEYVLAGIDSRLLQNLSRSQISQQNLQSEYLQSA